MATVHYSRTSTQAQEADAAPAQERRGPMGDSRRLTGKVRWLFNAPRFGLAPKIILAAAVTAILSIMALAIYMSYGQHQILVERDTERLGRSLESSVARARAAIEFYRKDALMLAKTPPTQGLFRAKGAGGRDPFDGSTTQLWRDRLETIFAGTLEARPGYMQVRYIGLADGGRELVRVDRLPDGSIRRVPQQELQSKADRPYFQEAIKLDRGQVYISRVELNREFGEIERPYRPVARFATPVLSAENKLLGIIVINIEMKRMLANVTEDANPYAQFLIANEDGDYLIHPDKDKTFGFDLGERHLMQEDFPALAGFFGGREFTFSGNLESEDGKLLAVAKRLEIDPPNPDRFLVISEMQPVDTLDTGMSEVRYEALSVAAVILLLGLVLMVIMVRLLVRPVSEISSLADKVARGSRQVEIGKATMRQDEVGVLARSFETMVREVEAREDALRASEARTSHLIDVMPEAILLIDAEGIIKRVNEQATRIFGHSRDELLGQAVEMLIPQHARSGHVDHRKHYRADPRMRRMGGGRDLYGLHKDGREVPVEIALAPLDDANKGDVVVSVVDITERKAAADALRASNEKLSRTLATNKELAQFAYVASHDLQEPLRMVDSYMGLLKRRYEGQLDKDADEFIGYAVNGARRMKRLINDLLDYSRVSNRPLKIEQVDLNEAVKDVLLVLRERIDAADGEVAVDPLPTLPADPGQIDRLLTNLIGNAAKFSGDAPLRVKIGAEHKGNHWEVTIADNGIGIEPQFHRKVFEIFSRLHDRTDYDGTGIGLAACKRIVELHGGTIWVESGAEGGSVFHFTLPDEQDEELSNDE